MPDLVYIHEPHQFKPHLFVFNTKKRRIDSISVTFSTLHATIFSIRYEAARKAWKYVFSRCAVC